LPVDHAKLRDIAWIPNGTGRAEAAFMIRGLAIVWFASACGNHSNPATIDAPPVAIDAAIDATTCSALATAPLHSIDELHGALRSTKAFPFPGGWQVCAGTGFCTTPENPATSFKADFSAALCGQNYEGGFESAMTLPMTIVTLDTEHYAIDIDITGQQPSRYLVEALGSTTAPSGLRFTNNTTQAQTIYVPLVPLP
jgi:hypothetical protein